MVTPSFPHILLYQDVKLAGPSQILPTILNNSSKEIGFAKMVALPCVLYFPKKCYFQT